MMAMLRILSLWTHLQDHLSSPISPSMGPNGGISPLEKQQTDERSSVRSRGWINWFFLGMLGAGETADSSQFSGVVSDEVIKVWYFSYQVSKVCNLCCFKNFSVFSLIQDIYEATEFDPVPSLDGSVSMRNKILSSVKFNILQITATLGSKYRYFS